MDKVSASNEPAPAPADEPRPAENPPAEASSAEQKPATRQSEDGKSEPDNTDAAANPAAALPLVAQLLPAQVTKQDTASNQGGTGTAATDAPVAAAIDAGTAIKQTLLGMKDGAAPVNVSAPKPESRVDAAKAQTAATDATPTKAGEPAVKVEGTKAAPKAATDSEFTLDKAAENRQAVPERPAAELQQAQIPAAAATANTPAVRTERPDVASLVQGLPVTHPRFGEAISQQIMVLTQDGVQHAKITLNPPELGPVEVRISLRQDEASVQLAATSGVTRHAIEDALPKLRDMLDQVGVRLGDTGVFAQLPQKGGAENFAAWRADSAPLFGNAAEFDEDVAPGLTRSGRVSLGLVDAYV